jgi:thioester reductase-like protein
MGKDFISLNDLKKCTSGSKENINDNTKIIIEDVRKDDIAIIGISCKFADAENLNDYWRLLIDGKECVREIPISRKKNADKYYEQCGIKRKNKEIRYHNLSYLNEIDKFDNNFFQMSPSEAQLMDPKQRLFLETAWSALEDSGYSVDKFIGTKTGVYLGLNSDSAGGYEKLVENADASYFGTVVTGNLKSIIASRLSYILDLKGPTMIVDTACSSSLVAVHLACQALRTGDCELALAGGVNLSVLPDIINEKNMKMGIESSDFKTKTFDDTSDGTNGGEGVAAILLKPLHMAINDNDNIYSVIKGSAVNQDGTSVGITAPNVKAQENVILDAWRDANINPETITYIEAHGTGTKLGDPIEVKAIQNAFSKFTNRKQFCAIGSVKTNIGHTDSLAGIAGLIKAVIAIKNKKIPASLNFKIPNRNINFQESPVYVNDRLAQWETDGMARRCGVSSFGMSGTNCHIVLEEAPIINDKNNMDNKLEIITLSAKSLSSIKELINRYSNFVDRESDFNLSDVCYVANTGRRHYKYRICIIVKNKEDFKNKIRHLEELDFEENSFSEIFEKDKAELKRLTDNNIEKFLKSGKRDENALMKICELYKKGVDITWDKLYEGENRRKVSIPTYPFERNRCWFEVPQTKNIDFKFIEAYELIEKDDLPKELAIEMRQIMEQYKEFFKLKTLENNIKSNIILKGREQGDYTENENQIASAWHELTGYNEVNIFENFFDMGIDSIQASAFAGKLRVNFNVNFRDLYEYPTIATLGEHIRYNHDNLKTRLNEIKNALQTVDSDNNHQIINHKKLENELAKYHERNKQYDLINVKSKKEYKDILLTGATGYLGIHILRELLIHTKSNVHVLVRSNQSINATERLKDKMKYYFNESFYDEFKERIIVIDGDLTKEHFGISQNKFDNICNNIECVIHSAANVNHYGNSSELNEINIKGTERLINFAKNGKLKDFNYISTTALVAYKTRDNGSILFSEYDDKMLDEIDNYYLYTKAEAEKMVIAARKESINANIFRVGNIVFNSDDGKFQENINDNAFYLVIQSFIKIGLIPEVDIEIDCSFVDYISRAIVLLFDTHELKNETYHICNPNLLNITEKLAEKKLGLEVEKVSVDKFFDYVIENYNDEKASKYIQNLIIFLLGDLSENMGETGNLPIRMVSAKTSKILNKLGFEWTQINIDNLKKMIEHCKNVNFI